MPTENTAPDLSEEQLAYLEDYVGPERDRALLTFGPSLLAMAKRTLAAEAERDALKADLTDCEDRQSDTEADRILEKHRAKKAERERDALKAENERLTATVMAVAAHRQHVWGCVECVDADPCDVGDALNIAAIKAVDAVVGKPGETEGDGEGVAG